MSIRPPIRSLTLIALLGAGVAMPAPVLAQATWADDEVTGGSGGGYNDPYGGDPYGGDPYADDEVSGGDASRAGAPARQRLRVQPYIEVSQVVTQQIEPGDETAAYAQIASGTDLSVQGRRAGGSLSLRYERVISYGDNFADSDSVSGVARGYTAVAPGLTLEAGGLAARTRVENGGGAVFASGQPLDPDNEARTYGIYAGPNYSTRVGPADVSANYRFGYNRIEQPAIGVIDDAVTTIDVSQESVVHSANARVGVAPGRVAPVGFGIGGGAFQEEISNSDQRVRDLYARADVSVPLAPGLAAVGGVGYEYVEVANRDVVRDAAGNPVRGPDGQFQTDEDGPRRIAFETEGLIWDVGVVWKPSRRTQFSANYGRRYDSDSYYGSFDWRPTQRTAVSASVYNTFSGFGGVITNSLADLPTNFVASRNALTGDFTGCVTGTETGPEADVSASCLGGALSSVRSAIFRNQGASLAFSTSDRRLSTALSLGYDRRRFFGAPGTLLAAANGTVDESYYASVTLGAPIDPLSAFSVNGYASYLDQDAPELGDALLLGASAAYSRTLLDNLSARAALSVDAIDGDGLDQTNASALVGLRYDF